MVSAFFVHRVVSLIPIFLVSLFIECSTSFIVSPSPTLLDRPHNNVIRLQTSHDDSASTVPPVLIVDSMPERFSGLSNTYYLLRHGQSTANIASIISSDRYTLAYTNRHGLTEVGYDQGRGAAKDLLDLLSLQEEKRPIAFVSSPFARARQTAEACQSALRDLVKEEDETSSFDILDDISIYDGLMERSFGRLDGEEIRTYAYVWPLDKFNVTHTAFDVESVAAVCTRFRQTILDIEDQLTSPHSVVLASHADVLQIAQLYAAGVENVGEFSSYRFQNGEVRKMLINVPDSLPEPSPLLKPDRSTRQE